MLLVSTPYEIGNLTLRQPTLIVKSMPPFYMRKTCAHISLTIENIVKCVVCSVKSIWHSLKNSLDANIDN